MIGSNPMSSWAQSHVKQEDPPSLSYQEAVRYIPEGSEDLDVSTMSAWHGGYELAIVYA